ncbi:hypothetical protein PG996_006852 [Apiospora saccharicola]|uniref:Uncharacterized protein n=1 Tax=Apiospora saccharicola TaxID=335842 RepID=A0ABR1V962_9PEZI
MMDSTKKVGGTILSASLPQGSYGPVQGSRLNPLTNKAESFKGDIREWSSNVYHLKDTTVSVEDLSNVNVECDDETAQRLLNSLRPALVNDSSTPDYEFHDYTMSQDQYGVIIEEFTLDGFKVHRRTFNMFDTKDMAPKGYSAWAGAGGIQDQATKRAKLDELTVDETLRAVASLLFTDKAKPENERRFLNKEGKLRRKNAETWPALKTEVHGQMFRTRDDPDKRRQVMQGFDVCQGRTDPEYEACFRMAKDLYNKAGTLKEENKHNDYLVDVEAARLCDSISGKDIVILRDRNEELITGVATIAAHNLFTSKQTRSYSSTERMH